jgi:hypothetical protein
MLFLPFGCETAHCTKIVSREIGKLTVPVAVYAHTETFYVYPKPYADGNIVTWGGEGFTPPAAAELPVRN